MRLEVFWIVEISPQVRSWTKNVDMLSPNLHTDLPHKAEFNQWVENCVTACSFICSPIKMSFYVCWHSMLIHTVRYKGAKYNNAHFARLYQMPMTFIYPLLLILLMSQGNSCRTFEASILYIMLYIFKSLCILVICCTHLQVEYDTNCASLLENYTANLVGFVHDNLLLDNTWYFMLHHF